jgi:hypothetical protein
MKKDNDVDLTKPERPDKNYIGGLVREVFSQRIAIIAMLVICLALCGIIIMLLNKPVAIAVVNGESGFTSITKAQKLSFDILEKQLLFYSREFCEDYFGRNHVSIRQNRERAFELMHPNMKADAAKEFTSVTVGLVLRELWTDKFDWKITVVTEKNDPRYSVFCQFDVTFNRNGEEKIESHNVKLDFGRLVKASNPFDRPHSLVLLKVQEISGDELKKQLNLTY